MAFSESCEESPLGVFRGEVDEEEQKNGKNDCSTNPEVLEKEQGSNGKTLSFVEFPAVPFYSVNTIKKATVNPGYHQGSNPTGYNNPTNDWLAGIDDGMGWNDAEAVQFGPHNDLFQDAALDQIRDLFDMGLGLDQILYDPPLTCRNCGIDGHSASACVYQILSEQDELRERWLTCGDPTHSAFFFSYQRGCLECNGGLEEQPNATMGEMDYEDDASSEGTVYTQNGMNAFIDALRASLRGPVYNDMQGGLQNGFYEDDNISEVIDIEAEDHSDE